MKIQEFLRFRDINLIQPQRVKVSISAFTLPASVWANASQLLVDFLFANDYYFTLKLPVRSFGDNFVAAVSYVEDNITRRYKLWDDGVLFYPVYNGDIIGLDAKLEIWSINTTGAPVLASDKVIETSVLVFQTNNCCSCCSNPDVTQVLTPSIPVDLLYGYCNPFCLPLVIP